MAEEGAAANFVNALTGLKLVSNGDLVYGLTAVKKLKASFIAPAIPLPVEVFRKQE